MPIDYFRRIPRDFTEGTSPGVLMTIVSTCIMGSLFVLEVRDFMDVQVTTDVIMDDSNDFDDIQINFDMLMPDLVCQFASIDVSDMMGTNRQGITKNIVMQRIDSTGKTIQRVDYTGDQVLEYESGELLPVRCIAQLLCCSVRGGMSPAPRTQLLPVPPRRSVDTTPSHDCRATMYDKSDFGGWKSQVPPGQFMFNELDKKEPWKNDEVRAQPASLHARLSLSALVL